MGRSRVVRLSGCVLVVRCSGRSCGGGGGRVVDTGSALIAVRALSCESGGSVEMALSVESALEVGSSGRIQEAGSGSILEAEDSLSILHV